MKNAAYKVRGPVGVSRVLCLSGESRLDQTIVANFGMIRRFKQYVGTSELAVHNHIRVEVLEALCDLDRERHFFVPFETNASAWTLPSFVKQVEKGSHLQVFAYDSEFVLGRREARHEVEARMIQPRVCRNFFDENLIELRRLFVANELLQCYGLVIQFGQVCIGFHSRIN